MVKSSTEKPQLLTELHSDENLTFSNGLAGADTYISPPVYEPQDLWSDRHEKSDVNHNSKRAWVDDIEDDEDLHLDGRFYKDFLGVAGKVLGYGQTTFETHHARTNTNLTNVYEPFADAEEWQLAE